MKYGIRSITLLVFATCLVALTGCFCPCGDLCPGETRTFDGIEFQWCPPGTFMMGSPEGELARYTDETQHEVTISQGFWLGKYEVTQEQWETVMVDNPSGFTGADRPVEQVSWEDAQEFFAAMNAKNGVQTYRLPTESEWEYACRAGTTTRYYWGDDLDDSDVGDYTWQFDNSSDQTHPVGEKSPNDWGLYDMSGNVWEWCQDWYGDYPVGPVTDPQGAASNPSNFRVLRGGSWVNEAAAGKFRSADRSGDHSTAQRDVTGFRLLRIADEPEEES